MDYILQVSSCSPYPAARHLPYLCRCQITLSEAGRQLTAFPQTRSESRERCTCMQDPCNTCPVNPASPESWVQTWSGLRSFHNKRGKQGTFYTPPKDTIKSSAAKGPLFNRICFSKVFVAWLYSTRLGTNCINFKMFPVTVLAWLPWTSLLSSFSPF